MSRIRLQRLMDRFGVTGNELAGYLHVDYSLVSKWRQGKRLLNVNSAHFEKIVEYFLGLDAKNHYSTLKLLFWDDDPTWSQPEPEEIYHLLARELSTSDETQSNDLALWVLQNKNVTHATYYWFKGLEGKIQAIKFMLEMGSQPFAPPPVEQAPSPHVHPHVAQDKELLLIMNDTGFWKIGDDPSYIEQWQALLKAFIRDGGRVRLMRTGMRHSDELAGLAFFWMPLFLSGSVAEYSFPSYNPSPVNYNLMLLKDLAFLVDLSQKGMSALNSTVLFLDSNSLSVGQLVVQQMFAGGNPVYRMYHTTDSEKLQGFLLDSLTPSSNAYFKSYLPPFGLTSLPLMLEVLDRNGLADTTKSAFMAFFQKFHETFLRNLVDSTFRCFFDFAELTRCLKRDQNTYSFLSLALGQPVQIPRDLLVKLLLEFVHGLRRYPNLHICTTNPIAFQHITNLAVMVAENTGLLIYPYGGQSICTTNMAVQTSSCYARFDSIFVRATGDDKNKFRLARLIEKTVQGEAPEITAPLSQD